MPTRRDVLKAGSCLGLLPLAGCIRQSSDDRLIVNDIHSQLNRTRVAAVTTPETPEDLSTLLKSAIRDRQPICIAGGRHAMGGQQFATDAILIDTRKLKRILHFDWNNGIIEVEG